MLSNAYLLAKFRFDTAENEPAKNVQKIEKFAKFANFADPPPRRGLLARRAGAARRRASHLEPRAWGLARSGKCLLKFQEHY